MNRRLSLRNLIRSMLPKSQSITEHRTTLKNVSTPIEQSIKQKLLYGKNILITGAGHNVGRGIALEMAQQGANIFFTDIHKERGKKLEKELYQFDITAKWFYSDISRTEDIEDLKTLLNRESTKIHVLVNNVATQIWPSPIREISKEEFPRIFGTNVFGPIYLTKLISQMMIEQETQGSILFITSIHQSHVFRSTSYSSSKAALSMIIRELAMELAPFRIRVNGISPGAVGEDEEGNAVVEPRTPLYGTKIQPCYIGRAAVALASEYYSHFTTGANLTIDGGISLHTYQTL